MNTANVLGWPPLLIAVQEGRINIVGLLLDSGAQINDRYADVTPLIIAAANDRTDVIKELIKRGADVNATASNGATALTAARAKKHRAAERILKKNGARELQQTMRD